MKPEIWPEALDSVIWVEPERVLRWARSWGALPGMVHRLDEAVLVKVWLPLRQDQRAEFRSRVRQHVLRQIASPKTLVPPCLDDVRLGVLDGLPLHQGSTSQTFAIPKVSFPFRGEQVTMQMDYTGMAVLCAALLSLEDPRIDAVFSAFQVQMKDDQGRTVWPKETT